MIMDKTQNIKFKTVDEYFSAVPNEARRILEDMRLAIKKVVPEAEEIISYNMPAFKFYKILVYYAAHKEHIGFYPGNAKVIVIFKDELKDFETSKGTIKFPINKKLPIKLIKTIVKLRANENLEISKRKMKMKK
jgi:uncharacterized protein YdhG (YjbR/CyaY superfamily)